MTTRYLSEDAMWDDSVCQDLPQTSPMIEYYKNKNIFLTGATGSVGQLMMCKLLSIDIGELTILVRGKKGKTPMERMTQIFKTPIFNRLRQTNESFRNKINIVDGDLLEKDLGMSERDIDTIIRKTHIVFHVAADVRFDQPFKQAIYNNVRSVYDMLLIAQKMKKLESFVYMSTAYSNHVPFIEEKVYNIPLEPEYLIKLTELIEKDKDYEFCILTERIIKPWPNTYTYTKNLAECLVKKYGVKLPAAIVRPSIIVGTVSDPLPGYVDNSYGLNGAMMGFGLGVLRILYANPAYVGDIIPCDYVSNATLAVAWNTALQWKKTYEENHESIADESNDTKIYNCVTSPDNPQTWADVNKTLHIYHEYPSTRMVWYTRTNFTSNLFMFKILTVIYHCFPAYFIDKILAWKGEKVRLMNIYRLIQKYIITGSCFMQNWKFSNTNMRMIYDKMNEDDHKYFPCDVKNISWDEFNYRYVLGLRVYFGKDPLSTMAAARKKCFKLKIAHYIVLVFYYSFIGLIIYGLIHLFKMQGYIHFVRDLVQVLFRQ